MDANEREVEEEIRRYLLTEVLENPDGELGADEPLISGLLDSFDLMQLLTFLEERFEITISNKEVVKRNFGSLSTLARFVLEKRAAAA
jgi:acyl carrier protein